VTVWLILSDKASKESYKSDFIFIISSSNLAIFSSSDGLQMNVAILKGIYYRRNLFNDPLISFFFISLKEKAYPGENEEFYKRLLDIYVSIL